MPTAIKFPLCLLSYGNDIGDRMNKIISYSIVNGADKLPDEVVCSVGEEYDCHILEHPYCDEKIEDMLIRTNCTRGVEFEYLKGEYLFAEEYYSSFTSEYQQDSWAHIGSDVFWKAKSGQLDYIYFACICGINAILGDNSKYKRIVMSRVRAAINGYKSESIYLKEEKKNPGKMLTIADRDLYRKIKKLEDWNYFRRYTYNNRLTYYSTQVKDPNELMGMVLEDRSKRKNGIDKDKEHKLKKKFGLI